MAEENKEKNLTQNAEKKEEKVVEQSNEKKVENVKKETEPKKEQSDVTVKNTENNNPKEQNKELNKETKKEPEKKFEQVKKIETNQNNTKIKKENVKKDKKTKPKKENKGMVVRIFVIAIILLLIIALIYLAMKTPERALTSMLKDLKSGDIEGVNQYVNFEEISLKSALDMTESEEFSEKDKAFYESLEWDVKSVKKENDTATIEIEATNKDYETIFKNYIQSMFQKFINNENVSGDEELQLLLDELNKDTIGTRTVTENVTLTKVDGKWKITVDDNLMQVIYPGLEEGINSISNLLSLN